MSQEPGRERTRAAVAAAAAILRCVFAEARPGIAFRLWEGSEVRVGQPDGSFIVVVHSPGAFLRAFASADTEAIGEEFVAGRIDVEGDLFGPMRIANQLDEHGPSWRNRLWIAWQRRRIPVPDGLAAEVHP